MKEITFKDIQEANETIKTTDVKGKDYAEVNQRIKAFRMVYPQGTIKTEMVSNENGVCIFKAEVLDQDAKVLATGTAYEKENSTFINKTSYIENCETSAVGRALGMCGFGIDTSVASAEEVQIAKLNQEEKEKKEQTPRPKEINYRESLVKYCTVKGIDMNAIAKQYKINSKSSNEAFKKVLGELKKGENNG